MRLDILPTASASTVDSHGKLQLVNLEKLLPAWKVAILKLLMPEKWRKMRDAWSQKFMDTIQEDIYARLTIERNSRPSFEAEESHLSLEFAA